MKERFIDLVRRVLDAHPDEELSARDILCKIIDLPPLTEGQTRRVFIPTALEVAWALRFLGVRASGRRKAYNGDVTTYRYKQLQEVEA